MWGNKKNKKQMEEQDRLIRFGVLILVMVIALVLAYMMGFQAALFG